MPKILERGKKYKKVATYRDTKCGSLVEWATVEED